jgi:hypothetical protein
MSHDILYENRRHDVGGVDLNETEQVLIDAISGLPEHHIGGWGAGKC